ncbi:UPF0505 protein C16orf62-like protein [Hypsibius exemplaris]|uniref:UPF0505 protein C16orf62-like protein n=1 Tax=Hypsibius exemplaris TaxID=2072580 RepID=A0A9X6NDN7_HYPEX|nr:UPF0505 protein C16orf62-like protein [Hypsibius exemplaris]
MADHHQWVPKARNYPRERKDYSLERQPTRAHPLSGLQRPTPSSATSKEAVNGGGVSSKTSSASNAKSAARTTGAKSAGFIDPLSMMSADFEPAVVEVRGGGGGKTAAPLTKEQMIGSWGVKKESILSKFTTTERLTLTSSYLSGDDRVVTVTKSNLVADRIQSRLEQLDSFEAGSMKEMLNLTQQEYVNKIDQLHSKLQTAWRDDQRVTALKIAIQLSKLLADISPLQFYPSKFVLVTDVLESFGQLIFDRIAEKGGSPGLGGKEDYNAEAAKETCRNWFFKVASIRELLPRLYIEISIMRCITFLEPRSVFAEMVPRFALMIRGIGDHLVASYARCYLARMVIQLAPEILPKSIVLVEDFVASMQQLGLTKLKRKLTDQKLDMSSYVLLHQPALEWITDCYAKQSGVEGLERLLRMAEDSNYTGLLLNCVMTSFKADLVSRSPMKICALIQKNSEDVFPTYILCRTLGLCLMNADTDPKERKKIMNEIWSLVADQGNPQSYISAAEIWVEFAAKFFTVKEVNRVLGDIISHLLPDRAYESCSAVLLQILERLIKHLRSFSLLLSMDKFMPFIDMLQKEEQRLEAAKLLLDAYTKYHQDSAIDPVIINGVLFASKIVHDSISSLSSEDEKRSASVLVCGFLRRIEFGSDFERQLNFYADCRGAFSNLDDVAEFLVHAVNNLAMSARAIQRGHHTRKTAAFVRACVAFSFITIPSLYDIPAQLALYLESAEVALANQCLGQADALIKAAIQLFNASKEELEVFATKMKPAGKIAAEFASNLLALMLVVPDPPEQGILYLVRGILNTIQSCDELVKRPLQMQLLAYASAARQEDYAYHVEGIDSNDRLYGPDPDFLQELDNIASTCLSELLAAVAVLHNAKQNAQAIKMAHELLDIVLAHGDLTKCQSALAILVGFVKTYDPKTVASLRKLAESRRRTDGTAWECLLELL